MLSKAEYPTVSLPIQKWSPKQGKEAIEGNENFKFASAGMHENLKFILNNILNDKYFKPI